MDNTQHAKGKGSYLLKHRWMFGWKATTAEILVSTHLNSFLEELSEHPDDIHLDAIAMFRRQLELLQEELHKH